MNRQRDVLPAAEFNLNCSLAGAVNAYDLLDIKLHRGILDNIIYSGLNKKTQSVLKEGKGSDKNGPL